MFFRSRCPHLRLVGTLPGIHSLHRALDWKLLKAALERTASVVDWSCWIWDYVCFFFCGWPWYTFGTYFGQQDQQVSNLRLSYQPLIMIHLNQNTYCFCRRQAAHGIKLVKKSKDKTGKVRVVPWHMICIPAASLVKPFPLDVIYPNWQSWGWYQKGTTTKCCISLRVWCRNSKFDPGKRITSSCHILYPRQLCRGRW